MQKKRPFKTDNVILVKENVIMFKSMLFFRGGGCKEYMYTKCIILLEGALCFRLTSNTGNHDNSLSLTLTNQVVLLSKPQLIQLNSLKLILQCRMLIRRSQPFSQKAVLVFTYRAIFVCTWKPRFQLCFQHQAKKRTFIVFSSLPAWGGLCSCTCNH